MDCGHWVTTPLIGSRMHMYCGSVPGPAGQLLSSYPIFNPDGDHIT